MIAPGLTATLAGLALATPALAKQWVGWRRGR
jgi:hypothetical protein